MSGKNSRRRRLGAAGTAVDPPGIYEYDMPCGRLGFEINWPGADGSTRWRRLGAVTKTHAVRVQRDERVEAERHRRNPPSADAPPAQRTAEAAEPADEQQRFGGDGDVEPDDEKTDGRPSGLTVGELIDRWQQDARSRCRRKTMGRYNAFVTYRVEGLREVAVEELQDDAVEKWHEDLQAANTVGRGRHVPKPLSAWTVYTYARTLLTVLRWGHEQGLVSLETLGGCTNVLVALTPPNGRLMALDDREVRALLASAKPDPQKYALILLGLACGLRLGEALGLTWGRVRLDARLLLINTQLEVSKNTYRHAELKTAWSKRKVTMPDVVAGALSALSDNRPDDGLVFCHADGSPIRHEYARNNLFYAAVTASGIAAGFRKRSVEENEQAEKPVFHHLRHTYASMAIARGVVPTLLAKQLGHRNSDVTEKFYAHFYDRHQHLPSVRRAIEDELGRLAG